MKDDSRPYAELRRRDILRTVRKNGTVSVDELASRFHVSGTTIRLDLTALEKTGGILRTHGGAVLNEKSIREPLISERVHEREKAEIAARAVELVENDDVLLIDTGTTMLALAQALSRSGLTGLTVYSNDLEVLRTLEDKEDWSLFLLGGRVRNGFHYTFSHQMIRDLKNLHFRKLFLATSALHLREGLTTADSDLALLKETMIACSETVCLLTDASKMHRVDFQRFADLRDLDMMITDRRISPDDLERLRECIGTVEAV